MNCIYFKIILPRDYRGSFRKAQGYKLYYDNNNSQEELKNRLLKLKDSIQRHM